MIVLLVDDELDILEAYPDLMPDFTWRTACSFDDALRIIETEKIDVAVIDSLGGVKGLKLVEICNALKIKTIAHTGGSIIEDSSFFDAVATKPDFDKLDQCLNLFKEVKNAA